MGVRSALANDSDSRRAIATTKENIVVLSCVSEKRMKTGGDSHHTNVFNCITTQPSTPQIWSTLCLLEEAYQVPWSAGDATMDEPHDNQSDNDETITYYNPTMCLREA